MREMYFLTTGSDYGIYCHLLYRMTLWPDYYLMVDIVAGNTWERYYCMQAL